MNFYGLLETRGEKNLHFSTSHGIVCDQEFLQDFITQQCTTFSLKNGVDTKKNSKTCIVSHPNVCRSD